MRLGTDIISIERIRQAVAKQPRFAEKILSFSELAQYEQYAPTRQIEFLAGRFCAKEAYVKALQTGIGQIKFTDISILNTAKGVPFLEKAPLCDQVHVSISHCQEYATATVLMEWPDTQINERLEQIGVTI